jgi:putative ABC transport system permease protein
MLANARPFEWRVLAFYLCSAFSGEFVTGLGSAAEMADVRSVSVIPRRIGGTLMAVFAGFALVPTAMGFRGVMAWRGVNVRAKSAFAWLWARSRKRSLGWSWAGMTLALIGLLLGLPLAWGMGRATADLLCRVAPNDFATFAGVAALLLLVAFAACCIPARRATHFGSIIALRVLLAIDR